MRVLGIDVLERAGARNAPLRKWLSGWLASARSAEWRTFGDVKRDYPSADGVKLPNGRVVIVFNVKGNQCRLMVSVNYSEQTANVREVLTHAEYSKNRWKSRH